MKQGGKRKKEDREDQDWNRVKVVHRDQILEILVNRSDLELWLRQSRQRESRAQIGLFHTLEIKFIHTAKPMSMHLPKKCIEKSLLP